MTSTPGIDAADLPARLRAALDWWLGELADMGRPLLRPLGEGAAGLVASRDATGFVLSREGRALGRSRPGEGTPAALLAPESLAVVRTVPAPGLSDRDWRRILLDEIDRLTPFAPEDVYAGVGFSGPPETRSAHLAVAPRARLDAFVAEARAAGVRPRVVLAGAGDATVDLSASLRSGALRAGGRGPALLWLAVALLVFADVGAAVWRDVEQTRRLQAEEAALRPAAERLHRLRLALDAEAARRRGIAARHGALNRLDLLSRLTRALPDGAYLDRLDAEGDEVRLVGRQRAGVDVPASLRAAGFRKVREATADGAAPIADGAGALPFDLLCTPPATSATVAPA